MRIAMEANERARWFERPLSVLRFELWIEDAAHPYSKPCPPSPSFPGKSKIEPKIGPKPSGSITAPDRNSAPSPILLQPRRACTLIGASNKSQRNG